MKWSDYEDVWKRQKPPLGANADLERLKNTFDTQHRKQEANLRVRDYAEGIAGIFVSIAIGFIWWHHGKSGWPMALAILLTLGVTAVFVRERILARGNRLNRAASLLAKVEADLAELRRQRKMILKMWWWYLLPLLMAILIVGSTITASRPPWDISRDPLFKIGFWIFNGLFCWFAWLINRNAIRKNVSPRIKELEKLRDDILSDQAEAL